MGKGAERDSGEVSGRAMRLQSRVPYVHILSDCVMSV